MLRTRLASLMLVGTAALLGCGGGDNAASNSNTTSPPSSGDPTTTPTTNAPPSSVTEATTGDTSTTTSTVARTSTTSTTGPATTTPSTATPATAPSDDRPGFEKPPTEVFTVTIQIPDGEFIAGPTDLVVLRADGDLEYLPEALSPNSARPPIPLADYPNPRIEPEEGPGPNFVEDVAGVVNGSLIYGDCCEPVSGNIFAIPSPERGELFGAGFHPELSPDGTELVAANATLLTAFDLATGEGIGIQLNQQPNEPFEMIMDLEWIDDDTFMAVILRGDDYRLARYDASTLAIGSEQLDLEGLASLDQARFAGRTPDGLIGVQVSGPDLSNVRYYDADTFAERTELAQTFPPPVSNIEIDAGGLGQIWEDNRTLYHLPSGSFVAQPITDDVLAGWFVPRS